MIKIIVDGREIELAAGERLNAIQAAARAGVTIPYYCWHPALSVVGSCRMCLVEVGMRDAKTGAVTMLPKLTPACNTPAKDGTVIVTNTEKVARARAMVEEDLLLRHPVDCPICDKAGECSLQDFHFRHGRDERRAEADPTTSRRRDLGDVTLFVDRCVLCSRCVRFTREISGTKELFVTSRGNREEIEVLPGFPLANKLSGNVVDLCPVGALGDKQFLYKQRVWFLRARPSICTGCATGCSIWIDENQDRVHRIRPRENPQVNQWWICNDGRYLYPHVHSDRRLLAPRRRDAHGETLLDWHGLAIEIAGRLAAAGRLAGVLSPHLTIEEAHLLATFLRKLDPQALLFMGPAPVVGADETFPNGFTIRAEKCPNRRGVEQVLARHAAPPLSFDEGLAELARRDIRGVWIAGGYPSEWIDAVAAERFECVGLRIVQDLFPSPLSQRAVYELPGAAFPEREGSYVNCQGLRQAVARAIRPPAGVRSEGSVYWELLERGGLYQADLVREEFDRMEGEAS